MTEGITTDCPYYLAAKGLHPEGIFVWDNYEAARSLNQELTFQDAERFFAEEQIPFGPEQKRTLGLVSEDGVLPTWACSSPTSVRTPLNWQFFRAPARWCSRTGRSFPA
mgnify:CR=1 FL=1